MEAKKAEERKALIRSYIVEYADITDFKNDQDLFASGVLNSLFAIQLMIYLEKTFGVKVTMDDLDMDNFKSVTSISDFVQVKQKVAASK